MKEEFATDYSVAMSKALAAAERFFKDMGEEPLYHQRQTQIYQEVDLLLEKRPELEITYQEPKLQRAADDCLEDIGIRAAFRVIHAQKGE